MTAPDFPSSATTPAQVTAQVPANVSASASSEASAHPPASAPAPAHVAILDDEPDITQLLAGYLASHGFRTTQLHTGRTLMDLMAADTPDLVLLDLGLPGEDGFVIARQLREHWRCGLVIVTGPDGEQVALTTGEFDLLHILMLHPGRVLSRDFLLEHTRGRESGPFDRTIDVQVGRLRRKLGAESGEGQWIKSVRGAGYLFAPRVTSTRST